MRIAGVAVLVAGLATQASAQNSDGVRYAEQQGTVMAMPPNSNLGVPGVDGQTLTLTDDVCAASALAALCSTTYRRMQ